MAEQAGDDLRDVVQDELAGTPFDDQEGEDDLQAEPPDDGTPLDGATVCGECVSEGEEEDEAKQTGVSSQRKNSEWEICDVSAV